MALFDGASWNDIIGSSRSETLAGTMGDDFINGKGGDDRLLGKGGDDEIKGGSGLDTLIGGGGHDTLFGGIGNDRLLGGAGLDALVGGNGRDILVGGARSDSMTGGRGADRFVFVAADVLRQDAWSNTITDFSHAQGDRINIAQLAHLGGASGHFDFIGSEDFTGAHNEVRVELVGGVTVIEIDIMGYNDSDVNGTDLAIELIGAHHLVASDFIL